MTATNLHVLDGFQCIGEGPKRRLEWTEIVSQRPLIDTKRLSQSPSREARDKPQRKSSYSRKKSFSNGASRLDWKAGNEEECSWLDDIWYQILHVDCGYHIMPLEQVCDSPLFVSPTHTIWYRCTLFISEDTSFRILPWKSPMSLVPVSILRSATHRYALDISGPP
jgi:hypothetical protein